MMKMKINDAIRFMRYPVLSKVTCWQRMRTAAKNVESTRVN